MIHLLYLHHEKIQMNLGCFVSYQPKFCQSCSRNHFIERKNGEQVLYMNPIFMHDGLFIFHRLIFISVFYGGDYRNQGIIWIMCRIHSYFQCVKISSYLQEADVFSLRASFLSCIRS